MFALVAFVVSANLAPTAAQAGGTVIVGSVDSGNEFWHATHDGLLVGLRQDSTSGGWVIGVVPQATPGLSPDFVYYATPPYRGDNPRYLAPIYGNTAAQAIDYSPREVRFVRTDADYERAQAAVRALLWPNPAYSPEAARATLREIKERTGALRLEITGARLATTPDGRDRIERLEFRIVVDPGR